MRGNPLLNQEKGSFKIKRRFVCMKNRTPESELVEAKIDAQP